MLTSAIAVSERARKGILQGISSKGSISCFIFRRNIRSFIGFCLAMKIGELHKRCHGDNDTK